MHNVYPLLLPMMTSEAVQESVHTAQVWPDETGPIRGTDRNGCSISTITQDGAIVDNKGSFTSYMHEN